MGLYTEWEVTIDHHGKLTKENLEAFCKNHDYFDQFFGESEEVDGDETYSSGNTESFYAEEDFCQECKDFMQKYPDSTINLIEKTENDDAPWMIEFKDGEMIRYRPSISYEEDSREKI